ncbi:Co2+/Mg2+ efflux protein ApaG [Alkalilimnicola sp. S0819]|uniref:Co2+/Mg2+ efflux protein ApaG n=1 Tax=Alkalilimnicola sp. S0819 TaxID=2613922 RepID=UPI0012618E7E|nr:Co2+/Mg2+ efflux protein ApaG [Alkalilimnicola sp. S0819]KAB7628223.1 Co2+/Mg2+ efflux protein ApaG [Alkalilimnicola sp. S0819]MPQ15114.1 Co2+/Mg2+ efflux protein ApaG [Alkalilimnicola sp. S0819]
MSEDTKYSIRVQVEPSYLEEQSRPEDDRYVFAYTVTITNTGSLGARLVSRHWIIADGDGREQEVRGEGVVGEQPWLSPGAVYRYTSGAVLDSPLGSMRGSYTLQAEDGRDFQAPIPAFTLAVPRTLH